MLQFTVFLKETVLNMLGLRLAFISHTVSLLIYTGLAASQYLNHQKYSSNPSKIFSIMYDVHTMHPNYPLLSDKKWIRFKIFASILNLFCCQYLNTTKPVSGRASGKDPLPHAPGEPLYEPLRFPDQDPLDEDNYLRRVIAYFAYV